MRKFVYLLILLLLGACNNDEAIKIKMQEVGGIYMVPATVNGLSLQFVFDTGASNVCISMTEAIFMAKNGYLSEGDVKGAAYSQLADGSVAENTEITLKTLEVGGITLHNITASVINNLEAPLLLGQSAIKKLGRISVEGDYLYIYRNRAGKGNRKTKIDKEQQAKLDSLVLQVFNHAVDKDYLMAKNSLRKAREMAYSYDITNRDWELDAIESSIKGAQASSADQSWRNTMPLLKSAYMENREGSDGIAVKYNGLLLNYARCLSLHYDTDGYSLDNENFYACEDEFNELISKIVEIYPYKAYCYSAEYYSDNFDIALNYCKKAIDLDSTKAEAYIGMGKIFKHTANDSERAIRCYKDALKKNYADSSYIYRMLSFCYPDYSREEIIYLKKAARLGDCTAQNILISRNIVWVE